MGGDKFENHMKSHMKRFQTLTHLRLLLVSYITESTGLQCKSIDWVLHNGHIGKKQGNSLMFEMSEREIHSTYAEYYFNVSGIEFSFRLGDNIRFI